MDCTHKITLIKACPKVGVEGTSINKLMSLRFLAHHLLVQVGFFPELKNKRRMKKNYPTLYNKER